MKRSLIMVLCVVLALSASTLGTLAFLTDTDETVNTFTIGNVDITVDEAKVDVDGNPVANAERVKNNTYRLIPGMSYSKDPTMKVHKGSSEAYVRMLVTLDKIDELRASESFGGADFQLDDFVDGLDAQVWVPAGTTEDTVNHTITYEFRYYQTVNASAASDDVSLEPLFTKVVIPAAVTGDELQSIKDMTVRITGYAIQKEGFTSDAEAWEAFDQQKASKAGDGE